MTDEPLQERFQQPAGWQWGHFLNKRKASLRHGSLTPSGKPVAHILFVEGLSEFAEKTFELARDFNRQACGFWIFDRQGQGLSDRVIRGSIKQHSKDFQLDVDDIIKFARDVMPKDAPIILMGHSTGGLMALMALHDAPELFHGAVITAPLLGIQNAIVRNREPFVARLPLPPLSERLYAYGGGPWIPREDFRAAHPPDAFSSDPHRMKLHDQWMKANPWLRTASPTYGWLRSACRAIVKVRDPAYLSAIKKPVMIFTGGKDRLVNNESMPSILRHLGNSDYRFFAAGKHELLMETDDIRGRILEDTMRFIQNKALKPA